MNTNTKNTLPHLDGFCSVADKKEDALRKEKNQKAFNLYSPEMKKAAKDAGKTGKTYSELFWSSVFKRDPGEIVYNALSVGKDSQGGYIVPEEFHKELIEALEEECVLMKLANHVATVRGDLDIPVVDSKGTADWVDEEGVIPQSDPSFKRRILRSHKLGRRILFSKELDEDSYFILERNLRDIIARSFAASIENAMLFGDGEKMPGGLLNESVGASSGTVTASSSLTADDFIDLYHSLPSAYREKAVFIMNDRTYRELRKLKTADGEYMYEPAMDNKPDYPPMLLGHKIIISDAMPDIAPGSKPVLFADMDCYWVSLRQPIVFKVLHELYAETDQIGIQATTRLAGMLVIPEGARYLQMKA